MVSGLQASHYAGNEITYTWVSGNTYTVKQKIYRDCTGATLGTSTIVDITPGSPSQITLTGTGIGTDITPICPGQASACNNGGGPYGIEEYIYQGTVTLAPSATPYTLSATLCCRNGAINTVANASGTQQFVYSKLTTGLNNSSPVFLNRPVAFLCVNQPATLSPNAFDPNGDAIQYSLQACLDNSLTTPLPYNSGFSATNPITSSTGVTLNPNTGVISFTPTVVNQVAVICLRADEYRNGVVIGSVVRDIQVRVLNCNNTPPVVAPIANVVVPVGTTFCTNVSATDINNNLITLTAVAGIIPPATFVVTSSVAGSATGQFCFTPTVLNQGNTYTVTINAQDNACPSPGTGTTTFNITVPPPCTMTATATGTSTSCGGSTGTATVAVTNGTAPITYSWTGPGGFTSFAQSISGLATGTYTVLVVDGNSCAATRSYTVASNSTVSGNASSTATTCGLSNGTVTITGLGGATPYQYKLDAGAFQSSGTFTGLAAGTHTFQVRDVNNCLSGIGNVIVGTTLDATPPTITCPASVFQTNTPNLCSRVVTYSAPTAADNCGSPTVALIAGSASGASFPVGTTVVTYRATDNSGNTATCSFTVTITDNQAPVAVCHPFTVNAVSGSSVSVTASQLVTSTSDNCAVQSVTIPPSQYNCAQTGQVFPVVVTVTDIHGNVSTCTSQVTVSGSGCNQPPVPVCQDVTINADDQCLGIANAIQFDGGSSDPNNDALNFRVTPTGPFLIGTTPVVITVTDINGASATCNALVTVEDHTPPTLDCNTTTINNRGGRDEGSEVFLNSDPGECGAVFSYTNDVSDNCTVPDLVQTDGLPAGSTFPVGTTHNIFIATDGAGNTATCEFVVTVTDLEPPVITCPPAMTVNSTPGVCGAVVTYSVVATDNCPGLTTSLTSGLASGAVFPLGNTTVVWTAEDAAGQQASCSFNVTVNNTSPATITCPANISVNATSGTCGAPVTFTATATDNCGLPLTVTTSPASGSVFALGTTTVTASATSGNSPITCNFTVTVTDNQAPVITCPANIVANTGNGVCTANVSFTATATDNCGNPTVTTSPVSGSTFALGTTTVNATATDAAGNTATCSFTVRVNDGTAPTVTCPANIVTNAANGLCTANVSFTATATDNCGNATVTTSPASGSTFALGFTTVTATATDGAGNTATCTFTVRVNDTQAPTITCPANQTVCGTNGVATVTYANPTTTDNCPGVNAVRTSGLASGASFPTGVNTVVYTATDASGNTATCAFTVTVSQFSANSQVFAERIGNVSGTTTIAAYETANGFDNDPYTMTGTADIRNTTPSTGYSGASGTGNVFFTGAGSTFEIAGINTSSFSTMGMAFGLFKTTTTSNTSDFVISVSTDGITYSVVPHTLSATGTGTAIWNTYTAVGFPSATNLRIRFTNLGTLATQYRLDDIILGGTSSAATITNVGNTSFCPGGSVTLVASAATTYLWSNGETTQNIVVTTAGSYSVTVTGANGCQATAGPVTVTALAGPSVTATSTNASCPGGTNGTATAVATGGTPGYFYLWTPSSQTTVTATGLGAASYTVRVTDANGCTATSNVVTVTDNDIVAPVAICRNVTVQLNTSGTGSTTAALVNNSSTDNCSITSLVLNNTTFGCINLGANTVTLTVTDIGGNTSTCTATVTVQDLIAPTAICQNLTLSLNNTGLANITASQINNASTDNCAVANLAVSPSTFNCTDVPGDVASELFISEYVLGTTNNKYIEIFNPGTTSINLANYELRNYANGNTSPNFTNALTGTLAAGGRAVYKNASATAYAGTATAISSMVFNGNDAIVLWKVSANAPVDIFGRIGEDPGAAWTSGVFTTLDKTLRRKSSVNSGVSTNPASGFPTLGTQWDQFVNTDVSGLGNHTFTARSNSVTLTVTDGSGNSSQCTSSVVVNDVTPPAAICQNLTVNLGTNSTASVTVTQVNNGSSDACGIATTTISNGTFNCANVGQANVVTLTVTDVNGNASTCNASVTVIDLIPPTVTCPANISVGTANGLCSASASYVATATDNCPGVTVAYNPASGSVFSVGASTVTATATDAHGNTATCSFTVTVQDNTPPTIVCNPQTINNRSNQGGSNLTSSFDNDVTLPNDAGSCSAVYEYITEVDDNCGIASTVQTLGLPGGASFPVGTTTNTWVVTDDNGNTASCSFNVTVDDTENPTITCPANIDAFTSQTSCNAAVTYNVAYADNCPGATLVQTGGIASGGTFPQGTTTNSFTASDTHGHSASCAFDVTVTDNVPPVAVCVDMTIAVDSSGAGHAHINNFDGGSTDNCGIDTMYHSNCSFDCQDVGIPYTVTLTLVDAAGNSSQCTSTVMIIDTLAPVALCQDVTLSLDANGHATITAQDVDGFSYDNCDLGGLTINDGDFDCSDAPGTTVVLTATDTHGNSSTCTAQVTVTDDTDPVVTCPANITLPNAPGTCGAPATYTVTGSDNCLFELSVFPASGSTFPVGTTTVTGTAIDSTGNFASCVFTVTVNDVENPTITCPANIAAFTSQTSCNATVTYTVNYSDNCPGATLTQTGGIASGGTFPQGTTTNSFTANDAHGHSASCAFDVTVTDNVPPVAVCVDMTIAVDSSGAGHAHINNFDGGSTDNCGIDTMYHSNCSFDCQDVGIPYTVTLTLVDAAGNSSQCTSTVMIIDTLAPVALCQDVTLSLDANGHATVTAQDVDGFSYDNCDLGGLTINDGDFDCSDAPGTTVVLTATDTHGNSSTCTAQVTVTDDTDPVVVCPANITLSNAPGTCGAPATYTVTGSDNCLFELSVFPASGSTFPVGTTTVTGTAIDSTGNFATCVFTVTVNDVENPTITCPANINAFTSQTSCNAVVTYTVNYSDNCPGATLVQTGGIASGGTFPQGTTTNSFTANDTHGHSASCAFDVTVTDNVPPVAVCVDMTIGVDSSGAGHAHINNFDGGSTDNCGIDTMYHSNCSFDCQDVGIPYTVTLTLVDAAGNSSQCTSTVMIIDTLAPVALCQDVTLSLDANGHATITAQDVDGFSYDNCDLGGLTINDGDFDCSDAPGTTVVLTATDTHGNSSTCTAQVTVTDDTDPVVVCPANITLSNAPGTCGAPATYTVTGSDNCLFELSVFPASGSTFPVGTTTVTGTAIDSTGNFASCVFTVTVNDVENPTITCPANIDAFTSQTSCNATVTYTVNYGDNCPGATLTQTGGIASGGTFPQGTTTNSFTANDTHGHSASCAFDVTVTDNVPPVAVCVDMTIAVDSSGAGHAHINNFDGGSTDNCGIDTMYHSNCSFDCQDVGIPYTVTLTLVDAAGNSSQCTSTVMIIDTLAPVALCQDVTLSLDANGHATITAQDVDGFSYDNCDLGPLTINDADFDCSDIPGTTVVLTATDTHGNSSTCTAQVTVTDDTDPTVTCPANITVSAAPGMCSAMVNYNATTTDNCSSTVSLDPVSGTTFLVGTTTVTATATDASGNTATCSFTVTVIDNEAPSISCPTNITENVTPGLCAATVNYMVATEDNCGSTVTVSPASGSVFTVGTTTVTAIATDLGGNTTTCSFTVTVIDNETPSITCPASITVNAAQGQCGAVASYTAMGTDNCPGVSVSYNPASGSVFQVGTSIVTATATDAAGNTASCSFTVTVIDNQAPVVTCPANITVNATQGQCGAAVTYNVTGSDNCLSTVSVNPASGSVFTVGTTTVTATATDASGNTASCSFTVTVNDNMAPAVTCPANITVTATQGTCSAPVTYNVTSTDNCVSTVSINPASGSVFQLGTTTVTATATDASGNTATCSFTVTVTDNQAPSITCPANITVPQSSGCGAIVTYPLAAAADNCGPVTVAQTGGPASGSLFPTGTTVVTFTATDAAGNTATCSFNVNVTGVVVQPGSFALVGDANATGNNCFQLTPALNNRFGAVWYQNLLTLTNDFSLEFDINLGTNDANGADGMAFVLQPVSTGSGSNGGGIGYQGITPSVDVEFDTWQNTPNGDPVADHIAINKNGNTSHATGALTAPVVMPNMEDGQAHRVRMDWDASATTLRVYYDNVLRTSLTQDIAATVFGGNSDVYWGWTAATGGSVNDQRVCMVNLSFSEALLLSSSTATSLPCGAGGAIDLTVSGGSAPYSYNWSNGAHTQDISGLTPGIYCVTVTDQCGQVAMLCDTIIYIPDLTPPVVSCPANIIISAAPGQCGAPATYTATATDNCPGVTVSYSPASGSTFPVGTTTVIATATDASGNTATCTFTVRVNDNQAPTVTCPANITRNAAQGQCGAPVTYNVTTTDNCASTVSVNPASGSTFAVGTTTVTATATDASGNTATCTFTVTVVDNQNPTVNCPANITVNAAQGQCGAPVTYNVTTTDNCASTVAVNPASGSVFQVGTTTVTAVATDNAGRTATCSFTVTVIDNQNPTVNCPANFTVAAAQGQCSTAVTYNVTGTDNCASTVTVSPASGSVFQVGTTTVTATASDNAGHTATCSFTVTVTGNGGPIVWSGIPANVTISCTTAVPAAPAIVPCGNGGGVSATGGCGPCPTVTMTQTTVAGNCAGNYTIVRTWTATVSGQVVGTRTQTITVVDNVAPVITCPANITVNSASGQCGANPTFNIVATDACSGATVTTNNHASGSFFPVGTTTVVATATDGCGNTATCTFTVTVVDNQNPTINCPANITTITAPGQCGAVVTYNVGTTDNCASTVSVSPASGSTFQVGTTTVNAVATDNAGRTATCSFTVTVADNQNPTVNCPANITVAATSSQCTAVVNYSATTTDNCASTVTLSPASGSVFQVGTTTVTAVATDNVGRTATCSFTVTVTGSGGGALVWSGIPANVTIACNAPVPAAPAIVPCSSGTIAAHDFRTQTQGGWGTNCNGNNPGCYRDARFAAAFPSGATIGCTTGFKATFTTSAAVNNYLPCGGTGAALTQNYTNPSCLSNVFSAQLLTAVLNVGFDNADPNFGASTTALGNLVVASGPLAGRTVSQVVAEGNKVIGGCASSFTLSQLNTALTSINENFDDGTTVGTFLVLSGGSGGGGVSVSGGCGPCPTVTMTQTTVAGNCAGNYTIIRTWTATSSTGVVLGTRTQTITVVDNTAPTVTCPANLTVNSAANQCGANPTFNIAATDACSGATVTTNNHPSGSFFPVGTTPVVATATDGCGNSSSCSFTVTVRDVTPPVVTCPGNITRSGCNNTAVTYVATATDNCQLSGITYNPASGSSFASGTTTVTVRATDASGNTATCTFNVTVTRPALVASVSSPADACGNNVSTCCGTSGGGGGCEHSNCAHSSCTHTNCGNSYCGNGNGGCSHSRCAHSGCSHGNCGNSYCGSGNGGHSSCRESACDNFGNDTEMCGHGDNVARIESGSGCTHNRCSHSGCTHNSNSCGNDNCGDNGGGTTSGGTGCGHDGVINVAVSGGCAPYTYNWSNGAHSATLSGLLPGTYTVTITDASGQSVVRTITLTQATALSVTTTATNVACYGSATGSVSATVSGGCGPYTYNWSTGAHSATLSNVRPGSYCVTVVDRNGCSLSSCATVTQPTRLVADAGSHKVVYPAYTPQACATITGTVSGGTPGYSVRWTNRTGTTTLGTGYSLSVCPTVTTVYYFRATDARGCTSLDSVAVCPRNISCGTGRVQVCVRSGSGNNCSYSTQCVTTSQVAAILNNGGSLGACNTAFNCTYPSTGNGGGSTCKTGDAGEGAVTEVPTLTLQAFPNPTKGEVTLAIQCTNCGDEGMYEVKVSDIYGKTYLVQQVGVIMGEGSLKIDLGQFAAGVYLVTVDNGDLRIVERVVKQ